MIKRFIVILTLLFTVITTAQEGTSSPYSFYGIGLTTFKGTVENRSMGGLSVFSDSIHLNLTNPASLAELRLTTFTVAGTHSNVNVESSTASEKSGVTSFDYLAIGIPVGRWAFSFGLLPYTSVGYNLQSEDPETDTQGRFTGRGGLNKVFLNTGFTITKNFSLGAGVDYGFGNLENKNIFIRENLQYGSRELNESRLSGFSYKFSANYQQMLSDKLQLRATGIYSPETKLKSFNSRQVAVIGMTSDGTEVIADGGNASQDIEVPDSDLTMPSEYTLGVGLGQPRKWFVGLEYTGTEASSFNNRSFAPEDAEFTDASKYRIGGFYIPDYRPNSNYFEKMVYRAGFRMEETGLHVGGEAIDEFGMSFGVGLPAGRNFENINLGIEYGQSGTTTSGLIQENFLNLSISLSLNDKWFLKRKFE